MEVHHKNEMSHKPMGGSPTIDLLVYTPVSGSQATFSTGLHSYLWFINRQRSGLLTRKWIQ